MATAESHRAKAKAAAAVRDKQVAQVELMESSTKPHGATRALSAPAPSTAVAASGEGAAVERARLEDANRVLEERVREAHRRIELLQQQHGSDPVRAKLQEVTEVLCAVMCPVTIWRCCPLLTQVALNSGAGTHDCSAD